MATIVRAGQYDPNNLASVAHQFGRRGDDAPILALLEAGTDPNTVYGSGEHTALHWAAYFDRPLVARALLKAGANPNCAGAWGDTPLMKAVSEEMAHLLLASGAEVDAVQISNTRGRGVGKSALMVAANQDKREVAAVLLAYHADIHLRDKKGRNALMFAAQADWMFPPQAERSDMIRLLLEAGARVGLVEAALLGDYDQTAELLADPSSNPAEVANARDSSGWTALMPPCLWGDTIIVELLLQYGADPNVFTDAKVMEH